MLFLLTLLLLAVGIGWFGHWYYYGRFSESTDDAYVGGSLAVVNATISGPLAAVFVEDTDFVEKNQLLAALDDTAYRLDFDKAWQQLAAAVVEVNRLSSGKGEKAGQNPLIMQQKIEVRKAYYHLMRCLIHAPVSGYVAQRTIEVGRWVVPTMPLMTIIPQGPMWVDANFKETQLRAIRVGQPATVHVDFYGKEIAFSGHVAGISAATGSVFSLIPAQNATGNWIKIIQRLTVRIVLDEEQLVRYPLKIGLSASATVDITDAKVPLAKDRGKESVASAKKVFDLSFAELDERMDALIESLASREPPAGGV